MGSKVSYYKNVYETKQTNELELDEILLDIKNGKWDKHFLGISSEPDKEKRQELKKAVPCFTCSGIFPNERKDKDIKEHSGYIICDVDDVEDVNSVKRTLASDKYVYSCFVSISGRGVCFIVKIDGKKHQDAFDGLMEYFYNNYQIRLDPSGRNVSRLRFVSFDPALYQNPESEKFKQYTVKPKTQKGESSYLFVSSQFEKIVYSITSDICGSYIGWFEVGCAIASKYGESGLRYFEHISQYRESSKRNFLQSEVSKQYKYCCISHYGYSINTFYHYAKLAGYSIKDKEIDTVAKTAYYAKDRGNKNIESIYTIVQTAIGEETNLLESEQKEVIKAVLDDPNFRPEGARKTDESDLFTDIIMYLRLNYNLTRNEITKFVENNGQVFEEADMNSLYIDVKKAFPKAKYEDLVRIINSNETKITNPLKDYLKKLEWDGHDHIFKLAKSIKSLTGDIDWRARMLKRWFVGMIENVYGGNCPLMLVLTGKQLTGKTSFFNQLLPDDLKKYYGESQLNTGGTDDKLLMTQKLIIYDDEFSGKSKQDSRIMKLLLSAKMFSMRAPYGRKNMDYQRLAVLCGTANEEGILNDPTGNRRVIVFKCDEMIDWSIYNNINKVQLFAQAQYLFDTGEQSSISREDKDLMDKYTFDEHYQPTMEAELILKYFDKANPGEGKFYTSSEMLIVVQNETRDHKLYFVRFGAELRRLGFVREYRNKKGYGYWAKKKDDFNSGEREEGYTPNQAQQQQPQEPFKSYNAEEDLPF